MWHGYDICDDGDLCGMGMMSVIVGTMRHWHDVCNDGDLCNMHTMYVLMETLCGKCRMHVMMQLCVTLLVNS